MKKYKIRKDDLVVVLAGKHKKKKDQLVTGRVRQVLRDTDRVIIENVNLVQRQVKPSATAQGGTVRKEASIHISNVALWNKDEQRPIKVGWKLEEGKKVRFDKKTGKVID